MTRQAASRKLRPLQFSTSTTSDSVEYLLIRSSGEIVARTSISRLRWIRGDIRPSAKSEEQLPRHRLQQSKRTAVKDEWLYVQTCFDCLNGEKHDEMVAGGDLLDNA